jgi:hypothetical protein
VQQIIKGIEKGDHPSDPHVILELCEDIMLSDPQFALKSQTDDILWKHCFYNCFERMKQDIRKVLDIRIDQK